MKLPSGSRDQNVDAGLVSAAVDLDALVGVSEQGPFDRAGTEADSPGGHECAQDRVSDRADEIDDGAGDDGPDHLIDGQECVDIRDDTGPGPRTQDASDEHRLLGLEVGRLHLPAFVIRPDQLECR